MRLFLAAVVTIAFVVVTGAQGGADGNEANRSPAAFRSISAGQHHTCAVLEDNSLKCWGQGANGRLGYDNTTVQGDTVGDMAALGTVNLGPGRVATAVTAGGDYTCALLDDSTVKCWGAEALGYDNTLFQGDNPGEMAALPAVNLGAGRTATAITAGVNHTCVILDNGNVKCWGNGTEGRLGYGNTVTQGDNAGEMAALPVVNLGVGRTATAITAGGIHTCALLDDATVKCWGDAQLGQLGYENTTDQGDNAGEMAVLPVVNLGAGAIAITAGNEHTCALLANGTVKCWGAGGDGRLGYDDTVTRGDSGGEMAALPSVNLGPGRTAISVSAGGFHTCAVLDDHTVKCWGNNSLGQLGYDDLLSRGDSTGEMATLPVVNLGPGRTASSVTTGLAYTCAVLDDGTLKCWGANNVGQLGYDDLVNRGDNTGEMATIPVVNLGAGHLVARGSVNDRFANARPLPVPGSATTTVIDTSHDTKQTGEPDHAGDPGGRSVWFRFTAPSTGLVTIDTSGSTFDTVLAVYTGTSVDALVPVVSDDDALGSQSEVQFLVDGGTTYRIAVDGASGASGDVVLHSTFVIDTTDPTITIITPADEATYEQGQVLNAAYTCSDPGGTGIDLCFGSEPDGQPIDTSRVGTRRFTVIARDRAGRIMFLTRDYAVVRHRPDALIALGSGTPIGNDTVNTTGAGQAKSASVRNLGTATFRIPVENDGSVVDTVRLSAQGSSSRYTVTYRDGTTNITTEVLAGTYQLNLVPGDSHAVTLVIRARAGIPVGSRLVRLVTATSQAAPTHRDVVKATVTRR